MCLTNKRNSSWKTASSNALFWFPNPFDFPPLAPLGLECNNTYFHQPQGITVFFVVFLGLACSCVFALFIKLSSNNYRLIAVFCYNADWYTKYSFIIQFKGKVSLSSKVVVSLFLYWVFSDIFNKHCGRCMCLPNWYLELISYLKCLFFILHVSMNSSICLYLYLEQLWELC